MYYLVDPGFFARVSAREWVRRACSISSRQLLEKFQENTLPSGEPSDQEDSQRFCEAPWFNLPSWDRDTVVKQRSQTIRVPSHREHSGAHTDTFSLTPYPEVWTMYARGAGHHRHVEQRDPRPHLSRDVTWAANKGLTPLDDSFLPEQLYHHRETSLRYSNGRSLLLLLFRRTYNRKESISSRWTKIRTVCF